MDTVVITSQPAFFEDVRRICSDLECGGKVEHITPEALDQHRVIVPTLMIRDPRGPGGLASSAGDPTSKTCEVETREAGYALLSQVKENQSACDCAWETLSRPALLLRLRELAGPPSPNSQIIETILLNSSQLRMTEYQVPTRSGLIPKIRDRLLRGIRDFGLASSTAENHFCMALEESLANALYHGNLELCSSLKEDGTSRFSEMTVERENSPPYCNRRIVISEIACRFGLWITITDEGHGFDVQAAIRRSMDPDPLLASGRGLIMMQAFAHELFFDPVGNSVTLVLYSANKRRESRGAASESSSAESCLVAT